MRTQTRGRTSHTLCQCNQKKQRVRDRAGGRKGQAHTDTDTDTQTDTDRQTDRQTDTHTHAYMYARMCVSRGVTYRRPAGVSTAAPTTSTTTTTAAATPVLDGTSLLFTPTSLYHMETASPVFASDLMVTIT